MQRRPHRPLLLPPLARPSLYSPTPPVILRRWQPHTAANQCTLIVLYDPHAPLLCPPIGSGGSTLRPPPWCSRRGLVNMVNDRHSSEVDYTWRGRQLGPRPHARKCLLITRKIMIPPPDIRDPLKGPLYFAKKMLPPLTAWTHQLYLRTQGSASLLRTKK